MAFETKINIERKLAVINGFVEIPDGNIVLKNKLTPLDVLSLIPGSTLIKLNSRSNVDEIIVLDPTAVSISGGTRQHQLFVKLPTHDRLDGPSADWYDVLRNAARSV